MNNPLLKVRCILPVLSMVLPTLFAVTSCDNEWPDDLCDCDKGGNTIEGWGDANDSTLVHKQDTLGGFDISLKDWGDISQQDIRL